jgi:diacylglycerol kinase
VTPESKSPWHAASFPASLRHALDGIVHLLRTQWNARVELLAALLALALGAFLGLRAWEWVVLVLQIALVLALEAVNTALEALCDEVALERRPRIKAAKDVAAGAVLIAALASLATGAILFAPKVADRFF